MKKAASAKTAPAKGVEADLLYGDSCAYPNIRWFSKFSVVDPIICIGLGKKRIGAVSLLEVERAKAESAFTEVHCIGEVLATIRKTKPDATVADVIVKLVKDAGATAVRVPLEFPAGHADRIRELGLTVTAVTGEFFPARIIKTEAEQKLIAEGNRGSAAGFAAVERILGESEIRKGDTLYWREKVLTSERLQAEVNIAVAGAGAANAVGLIIAGGEQAVDCHCHGHGPIKAGRLIVADIYPRNLNSGYYGDMTRTFVKGPVSPERAKLVKTVLAAQKAAMKTIKAGVPTHVPYDAAMAVFEKAGYKTGKNDAGVPIGFFHGLGHGLGLEVHEAPRMGPKSPGVLEEGMVLTVEPGLYYPGIGGARIEDVIAITKTGYRMLSKYHYDFQVA